MKKGITPSIGCRYNRFPSPNTPIVFARGSPIRDTDTLFQPANSISCPRIEAAWRMSLNAGTHSLIRQSSILIPPALTFLPSHRKNSPAAIIDPLTREVNFSPNRFAFQFENTCAPSFGRYCAAALPQSHSFRASFVWITSEGMSALSSIINNLQGASYVRPAVQPGR